MKNTFSLVYTYLSWPSLSLPTPRMSKASESCMVSAAEAMVKTALLQAVQIKLLSLRNDRSHYRRPTSSA